MHESRAHWLNVTLEEPKQQRPQEGAARPGVPTVASARGRRCVANRPGPQAVNPYGRSKLIIEDMFRDLFAAEKDWQIILLRYFNPVGAHASGDPPPPSSALSPPPLFTAPAAQDLS